MKLLVFCGMAAAALTATAVHAQQGNGRGSGGDHVMPGGERSMADGGPGNADRAKGKPADRGSGSTVSMATAVRGSGNAPGNGAGNVPAKERADKDDRGSSPPQDRAGAGRNGEQGTPPAMRGNSNANAKGKPEGAGNDNRGGRLLADGRHLFDERGMRVAFDFGQARHGLIDGCPPGLAKKDNNCMPPGLAKKDPRYRYANLRPDWWGLGRTLGDGRYYYDNGYLLRLTGDRVAGYIPLLGGALSVGRIWPSSYAPVALPPYYANYFDLGPANSYRYADNVLYRVDPTTAAITSIAALLTGDDIRIGSPMPTGYDVYNVPYAYRSQYADGPNANYRYNDGYIYQLDPTTRLVTAAIELIAS